MHMMTRSTLVFFPRQVLVSVVGLFFIYAGLFSIYAGLFCRCLVHISGSFSVDTSYAHDDKIYSSILSTPGTCFCSRSLFHICRSLFHICRSLLWVSCSYKWVFLYTPHMHMVTRSTLVLCPRQVLVSAVGLFSIYAGLFSIYACLFCRCLFHICGWIFLHSSYMRKGDKIYL